MSESSSGPSSDRVIAGRWLTLVPLHVAGPLVSSAAQEIRRSSQELARSERLSPGSPWAPSVALVRHSDSAVVGFAESAQLPGYDGVASMSMAMAGRLVGRGIAIEAYTRYAYCLFDGGAAALHHEVFAFNEPVVRLLRHFTGGETARLRSHAYVGGRRWDVLVFSYSAAWFRARIPQFFDPERFSRRGGYKVTAERFRERRPGLV